MLKAYKYRLYPNADQAIQIDHSIGVCRLLYNTALNLKIWLYRVYEIKVSSFDLCYQLVEFKKEYPWINEVDSQALQAAIKKVDVAFKNFYKGSGYPKFKSKRKGTQSFQCPNGTRKINLENSTLTIPKIKNIPIRLSRTFEGKIKTITISKTPTRKYFASILIDDGKQMPEKSLIHPDTSIGIDLGINHFLVTSEKRKTDHPGWMKQSIKRLKYLQRRLRKKSNKKSRRRKVAVLRIAKLHERIANQRKDFLQKLSSEIISDNQTVFLEDLNIKGMSASAKGTIEKPGRKVKQKAGLNRSIRDSGWGMFEQMLRYKGQWNGKNVLQIGRFVPSSKECSCCHHINETLTLADREWTCANCGTHHDRDGNAGSTVKYHGLKQYYKQNSGRGTSVERVESLALAGATKREYISESIDI